MEKKIAEKVLRFIELSRKFSKSENEIVPQTDEEKNNSFNNVVVGTYTLSFGGLNSVAVGSGCYSTACGHNGQLSVNLEGRELYIDENGNVKAKDNKVITRVDKLKAIAEVKGKLLEEFWEYQTLQGELGEYFKALTKINE